MLVYFQTIMAIDKSPSYVLKESSLPFVIRQFDLSY